MRFRGAGFLVLLFLGTFVVPAARGQYDGPAQSLVIAGSRLHTWTDPADGANVAMVEGPVTITLDKTRMTARDAVVWVTPARGAPVKQERVEIALVGDASLSQSNGVTRSGPSLYVDARLAGTLTVNARERLGGDRSDSDLYQRASALRPVLLREGQRNRDWVVQSQIPTSQPATRPVLLPQQTTTARMKNVEVTKTPEGNVAAVLSGNVRVLQESAGGDSILLQAERAVLFTPLTDPLEEMPMLERISAIEQALTGAYLEGDVRITRTPAGGLPEQRLTANRAYYDFTTDRAVLTDVVLQTVDPTTKIPMIVRARLVRQLAATPQIHEYTAQDVTLSSSSFHTPSYSIGANSAYIRQTDIGNEVTGTRTSFTARDATFDVLGLPVLWLPYTSGSVSERSALRRISSTSATGFGFGVSTEWGLFESLGRMPPNGLDLSYLLDYYAERGPAVGLNGEYTGGFVDEATLEPWSLTGNFRSYAAYDEGQDDLGASRRDDVEPEDEFRGRFYWEHQHFVPEDWQIQVSGGYISDPTFLEEWFPDEFRTSRALDTALYAKRQRDSEVFTFLASVQPNDFVTTAESYQERFEIHRLPEISYWRVGDSILGDNLTFFSANTLSALEFDRSEYDLVDLGFRRNTHPGLPAVGWTGDPEDTNYRGDFRQELDWPFSAGRFRVVPYVIGRYTAYTESVDGSGAERLYSAAGVRLTTAFWKVDDSVQNELLDLHRLRHVIEPELNLYAAAQTTDRTELLIYDEPIDAIHDFQAVSVALRQRWQTKRGGPGRWRSVDFLAVNVEYNHFENAPDDFGLEPRDFRGLFFVSLPEASIPRDSVNLDAAWRFSDYVQLLGDASYNVDEDQFARGSVGFGVRQTPRLSYFLGYRHVGVELDTVIDDHRFRFDRQDLVLFATDYQLTTKYRMNVAQSYDFARDKFVRSAVSLTRAFDRWFAQVGVRVDRIDEETAIFFNLWPEGLERPASEGFRPGARR